MQKALGPNSPCLEATKVLFNFVLLKCHISKLSSMFQHPVAPTIKILVKKEEERNSTWTQGFSCIARLLKWLL